MDRLAQTIRKDLSVLQDEQPKVAT